MNETFDWRYAKVLSTVWEFPYNDQRPAVLKFLSKLRGRYQDILDVGCGDGYYWPCLSPKRLAVVEPNAVFRKQARANSRRLGISMKIFSDLDTLFRALPRFREPDLVMMIHVLLYMGVKELRMFLPWAAQRPLVLVYPDPDRSTTFAFEENLGIGASRKKITLKKQFLGKPHRRIVVDSHFRLPLDTDEDTLVFLISHLLLQGAGTDNVLATARTFVRNSIASWRMEDYLELPQAQIIEFYTGKASQSNGSDNHTIKRKVHSTEKLK